MIIPLHNISVSSSTARRFGAVIAWAVAVLGLAGCVGPRASAPGIIVGSENEFVRRVDYRQTPEAEEMAKHVRMLGNAEYPKILALLAEDTNGLPQQFDITFKPELKPEGGKGLDGRSKADQIQLNTKWLAKNPADLDFVVVHEMTHVAEAYDHGFWAPKGTFYWTEGLADYAVFKLGHANASNCPECSGGSPHYKSGYNCAAAFLLYLDATYGSNVVRRLNTELHHGTYQDAFFAQATGKDLDQLWAGFQQTPAYTPAAAEANRLRGLIGYVNDRPPRNARARFDACLKQQGDWEQFQQALALFPGPLFEEIDYRIELYVDLHRPHGAFTFEAIKFLMSLAKAHGLPGFSRGEGGQTNFPEEIFKDTGPEPYPVLRTFESTKVGDKSSSKYYYTFVRESAESSWKLQNAWRTDRKGQVVEKFPVQ